MDLFIVLVFVNDKDGELIECEMFLLFVFFLREGFEDFVYVVIDMSDIGSEDVLVNYRVNWFLIVLG